MCVIMAPLHKMCVRTQIRKIKRKSLMRDSDWLKINLRLIFLICVQTQILCNGAYMRIIQFFKFYSNTCNCICGVSGADPDFHGGGGGGGGRKR